MIEVTYTVRLFGPTVSFSHIIDLFFHVCFYKRLLFTVTILGRQLRRRIEGHCACLCKSFRGVWSQYHKYVLIKDDFRGLSNGFS